VVHSLLAGPRRRREIEESLPGIDDPTLDRRLAELVDLGLVELGLVELPDGELQPDTYGLTGLGRGLEPSIRLLASWGATVKGGDGSGVLQALLVGIVRRLVSAGEPPGVSECYELRVGAQVLHIAATATHGTSDVRPGPAESPVVIVETSVDALCDLVGDVGPRARSAMREITWSGDSDARDRCARRLGLPADVPSKPARPDAAAPRTGSGGDGPAAR
jgi:DNA-binding HxlR family transcriptional regulator